MDAYRWSDGEITYTALRTAGIFPDRFTSPLTRECAAGAELLRLSREVDLRDIFIAELVGALHLDREAIDRGRETVGEVILAAVRRLEEENERLMAELSASEEAAAPLRRLIETLLLRGPAEGCGSTRYEDARREAAALLKED